MSNIFKDENYAKHAGSIPETAITKIYNHIVRIEIDNEVGTGFFTKIKTSKIDSKKYINIYYGKKMKNTKK